ncbi:MAG: hypothetical protein BGO29_06930 [Bacteroidales bacterium 36-12]|nr:MAG: hypothetical protein BGO29_06930 [Bacteroidales bacterium 36-12]
MKTYLLTSIIIICNTILTFSANFIITNPNQVDIKDAPVVVELSKHKKIGLNKLENLAVFIDGKQVCSQLDDLNNDNIFDELVFITDLKAGEKKKISIKKISDKKRINCKQEVYTQLLLKESDGSIKSVSEVSSNKNDMYNKLHHHGVAFESELIAYRIYFDNKSTIDVYGKRKYRLELEDTKWYPTDKQLSDGYGDDILLVSDWVGVGSLKGFENDKMTHITKFDKRTQRIVSKGNIRTVVESTVEGWEYEGKKINITIRYIMYARHRDVIAEVIASEDIQTLATGVQQIGGGQCFQSSQLVGSWGSWHPQPDKVKYPKETVGLGLYLPKEYNGKKIMDGVNNLITFPYKKGEVLRFYFTTIAAKEELNTIENADEFFKYLNQWRMGLREITVE